MGDVVTAVAIDEQSVRQQFDRERAALSRMIAMRKWPWRPYFGLELEIAIVNALGIAIHGCTIEIKAKLGDRRITSELGDWELELNLTPVPARGRPFTRMYNEINLLLGNIARAAAPFGGSPVLIGIVPTLKPEDTAVEYMTSDNPRYPVLEEGLKRVCQDRRLTLTGTDSLDIAIRSVVDEAACTSQQLHIRTTPHRFPADFDACRIVAGPALAIGANSPILYGQRLRHAVRPALFEAATHRTPFGNSWTTSLLDSLDEALRQPIVLAEEYDEDPLDELHQGRVPALRAMALANGTYWRWHRPVWHTDSTDPHFRVEDRPDAAQPSVIDVMAQAAFKAGLARVVADNIADWYRHFPPELPGANFQIAQLDGPAAELHWLIRGEVVRINACELIYDHLVPAARRGLARYGVHQEEIDWLMDVIDGRALLGETGSTYQLHTFNEELARHSGNRNAAAAAMFDRYRRLQATGAPVHTWRVLEAEAI